MKKGIIALLVIVVLAGLTLLLLSDNKEEEHTDLRTDHVRKGELMITVGATGIVTPFRDVEVKSKASGEIISFPYEEGDVLAKGEIAVKLDPETERSRVNQARADLLSAEANLEKAKITLKDQELRLKRRNSLFQDKVISRQDLDDAVIAVEKARSDVKIAEAGLIRARETLKEAQDRLDDTQIRAPLRGTILKKYVEEGQVIASTTASVSEGTPLFTMADLDRMYIEALVDETDIGRVKTGQTATLTVDAYPDLSFQGRIVRIAPQGKVESTITTFSVTIEVEDENSVLLRP